jgi:hypothetical protein
VPFEVGDENGDSSIGTAASCRESPEAEGADSDTGSVDAASSGVRLEVGGRNVAPRSLVVGLPVSGPLAAGSGVEEGSANDIGKGKRANAKAAGHGKGKVATAPVGKPKAKPKGTPTKGKAGAKAKAKADTKSDVKSRAKHGTAGTFAGRRPPADLMKRKVFDQMKSSYLTLRLEGLSDEALSGGAARPAKKARSSSVNQQAFIKAMQKRMSELAKAGVPGPQCMRTAAAEWKAHTHIVHGKNACLELAKLSAA